MSRKKSIKHAAECFEDSADAIFAFLDSIKRGLSDEYISWCYDYAVIRLYREFENLILRF